MASVRVDRNRTKQEWEPWIESNEAEEAPVNRRTTDEGRDLQSTEDYNGSKFHYAIDPASEPVRELVRTMLQGWR